MVNITNTEVSALFLAGGRGQFRYWALTIPYTKTGAILRWEMRISFPQKLEKTCTVHQNGLVPRAGFPLSGPRGKPFAVPFASSWTGNCSYCAV